MSAVGASYRAVLALPQARRLFASAAVGRLSYAVVPLALLFVVRDATGSFGSAGLVLAAFNVTIVAGGPVRARVIDRYGRRRVLPVLLVAYLATLGGLLGAVSLRAPVPWLLLLAGLAGACPPPLGPAMRAIWGGLAPDAEFRQRAYSLDAVAEEVLFSLGPLLTGLAIAVASPWYAAVAGLALLAVGTVLLVANPASAEPAPSQPVPSQPAPSHPVSGPVVDPPPSPTGAAPARGGLLRRPGFAAMLVSVAAVSVALGVLEIAVPVSATRAGAAAAAGVILGVLSAGSAVGGLLYGRRNWTRPAAARLAGAAALLAVMLALVAAAPSLWLLGAGLALAGLFVSPILIIGYTLADELAPVRAGTGATTWVNTASNAGLTAGTAAAGLLADHVNGRLLYLIGASVVAVVGLTSARRPVWRR